MKRRRGPVFSYEDHEQMKLVEWLTLKGIKHFCVPNEAAFKAARNKGGMWKKLEAMGCLPGAPDIVLIDMPPGNPAPVAIEMKRGGDRPGVLTDNQKAVHADMHEAGWIVPVGYGIDDIIDKVLGLGY